ncbi:alpha/beta hydrolase domain-containing protein [uncultured Paludibaculum sp.]|uniref:alpha/beta hydrolase domain-containing protein n=1 Tax=uncultured Paludibaculum sp. TaxID=1765020 RepID=UPI002AABEC25|nr:alpha/beta hydrolase domain-containing protein [uncultured Paludibaculum sp.]
MRLSGIVLFCALPLCAGVVSVNMVERSDVLGGRSTGPAGPYERIIAKVQFAVDPALPQNKAVHDLDLATRNEHGLVEFTSDLYILKPRDPAKGNGTVLFEVSNRGGKGMLSRFNYAKGSADPRTDDEFGDMNLLEQGYTLMWLGWQWDTPPGDKLLRLDSPIATLAGQPIRGLVRAEFIPDTRTNMMALSDRKHTTYAAISTTATLTVRPTVLAARKTIVSSQWKFNDNRTGIEMESGFQPGQIYEVVYQAENPRVEGLGLAAVRDAISFMKYGGTETLLADQRRFIKRSIGFGISQSGRFLRTFLYSGFNEDEKGRKVFDGVWADVGGAGRGSFNFRFGQASRDGYAHFNTLYPTDVFPFTDVPQNDPETGSPNGLLMAVKPATMPKIFYTNGSWEYWNRCAALIHVSVDGKMDAPMSPDTRLYVVSGSQHGPGRLPNMLPSAQYPLNPNDHRPLQRALLDAMQAWIKEGKEPPASQYPLITEGQLVRPDKVNWPKSMKAALPEHPKVAYNISYGPDWETTGVITMEPPKVGKPFPVLVPQVDADGNELGGIRMPEVAVPLGTFTGWNMRTAAVGAPREMAPTLGSFFAFDKAAIVQRYGSRGEYLKKVGVEADKLVKSRFLLERDRQRVVDHAAELWAFVQK